MLPLHEDGELPADAMYGHECDEARLLRFLSDLSGLYLLKLCVSLMILTAFQAHFRDFRTFVAPSSTATVKKNPQYPSLWTFARYP